MSILSERTANQNYGKIKNIHSDDKHSSIEKTPKLWPILETIFINCVILGCKYILGC